MAKIQKKYMLLKENIRNSVAFSGNGSGNRIEMLAYSGGIIKNHWYWNDLAIDLKGIQFNMTKYPILEDHKSDRKIGFCETPQIKGNALHITGQLVDTEAADEFRKNSLAGFPYQSSIFAAPSKVEKLGDGATATVNGFTVTGPANIWRECEFREASICVFGWDRNTQASAFNRRDSDSKLSFEEENEQAINQLMALAHGYKPHTLQSSFAVENDQAVNNLLRLAGQEV